MGNNCCLDLLGSQRHKDGANNRRSHVGYSNDGLSSGRPSADTTLTDSSSCKYLAPHISIEHNSVPYECVPASQMSRYRQQQQQQQQGMMSASLYSDISGSGQPSLPRHQDQIHHHQQNNTMDSSKYSTIRPLDCQVYQFMDFPFLTSVAVIQWLLTTKILFLMRGPSGSGKSTIVDCLRDKYRHAVVCSRDHWPGPDNSSAAAAAPPDAEASKPTEKRDLAQNWLENQLYQALEAGRSPVIVDETHVRCWEYKYSVGLATKFDYLVLAVLPRTPWRFEPERLAEHNTRSEPLWELERAVNQFEPAVPLYYGWFLNDADSDDILQFSADVLETMINIQDIRIGLAAASDLPEFVSKEDLVDHWLVKADRLHVTTKFCGYGTVADADAYQRNGAVQDSLGQLFPVRVRGLLLTPRTLSGHVQLAGPRQIQLWAGDDQEDSGATGAGSSTPAGSRSSSLSKKTGIAAKLSLSSKPARRPFGCRAHLTLMYSEGVRPVQSGLDQLQVIDQQLTGQQGRFVAEIEPGSIVDWGAGRYYLELTRPIICQALFTGQY